MIIQLHWQNPQQPEETEFVAQADTDESERMIMDPIDWISEQIYRHKDSCPDKWVPMVCWGNHPAMILAAEG